MLFFPLLVVFLTLPALFGQQPSAPGDGCACDHSDFATLATPNCSLCQVAEKGTGPHPVLFVKDASPRKPNRTLALPLVSHGPGVQDLAHVPAEVRARLWKAAIAKAQELWPGEWGLAVNSPTVRTQCHLHVHIGKLNPVADESTGQVIATPEEIPAPPAGRGVWLHPAAGGLHVHLDREIAEPVLMR